MSLPHFASFPDAQVRKNIPAQDWQLYLDSWASLSDLYLQLDDQRFLSAITDNDDLATFILTFSHEHVREVNPSPQLQPLRKRCFLLLHRLLSGVETPKALLTWTALADFCHVYSKSELFRVLLHSAWSTNASLIEKSLQTAKNSLTRNLESKRPEEAESTLDRIAPLLKESTDASSYMLTGSDFLDALTSAYQNVNSMMQKKLTTVAYLGLTAILEGSKPNYSLLSDHLYSLKTNEEQERKNTPGKKTLVADLVTNTPLLKKIRDTAAAPEATRVKNTAAAMSAFRQSDVARPKRLFRRKVDKYKSKDGNNGYSHEESVGEVHVHRMSMVTQIQDLFPDLGAGFIVKLLDEYNEDIEQVTAHLLEESLPAHLANADRSAQLSDAPAQDPTAHLPPRSSQHLPERRNVFDDDEFDKLAVDASRLHIGRRGAQLTADKILSDRSKAPAKSSILAALAAFDSDDDERDDTYDAEDVGASVDTAAPGPDEADAGMRDKNEEALFRAFSMSPALFGRDSDTRKGKARAALKSETGMTDEAIEGWAIMIRRDPRRLRRLEAKFSQFTGQQQELASSSWRDNPAGSGDETGEASGDAGSYRGGRGRGGRGRGRGGRGGRGGGNVSGPADDKTTQVARQRKDANKASRANHNRKDQRGKKLARGGFPG